MDREAPKPGEIYRHFKGNLYRILAVGTHTETQKSLVVYHDVNDENKVWIRPLDNFLEIVNWEYLRFDKVEIDGNSTNVLS